MSGKIGLLTGSFDPVTLGHVDLIKRACGLFDRLYVGLFYNKDKAGFFSLDQRLTMLEEALKSFPQVTVITSHNQLAVDVAREFGVTHFVRGIRTATDLDYEDNLAYFNRQLAPELETIVLLTQPTYRHLSSSRVRELIHFKADISPYVPQPVITEVEKIYEKTP